MKQSLATKYRPTTFEDGFMGQHITRQILSRQLETGNFKNCYGFFGCSGTGKTTAARCFAKAINGTLDGLIEIDGGTMGNKDDIKPLIETMSQRSVITKYKIIIIDECQMIGGGRKENSPAWTAMLKGLEECPMYTIFIMCSTDPDKIPEAILNRLQRFNFSPIPADEIRTRLEYICQQEGLTNYKQTCDLISKTSKGCMREAITKLDQCADYSSDLDISNTKLVLSDLSYEPLFKLTWALQEKNEAGILEIIDKLYNEGVDLKNFIEIYLEFVIELTKFCLFKNIEATNIPSYLATKENPVIQKTVDIQDNAKWFNGLVDLLLEIKTNIRTDLNHVTTIKAYLLRACRG